MVLLLNHYIDATIFTLQVLLFLLLSKYTLMQPKTEKCYMLNCVIPIEWQKAYDTSQK